MAGTRPGRTPPIGAESVLSGFEALEPGELHSQEVGRSLHISQEVTRPWSSPEFDCLEVGSAAGWDSAGGNEFVIPAGWPTSGESTSRSRLCCRWLVSNSAGVAVPAFCDGGKDRALRGLPGRDLIRRTGRTDLQGLV